MPQFLDSFDNFIPVLRIVGCLVLTIIVEGIDAAIATSSKAVVKASVLCNLLTNPLLNVLLMIGTYFFKWTATSVLYYVVLLVLEIIVVFVEGEVYFYLELFKNRKSSYLFSLLFNFSSFAVGAILSFIVAMA